MELKCRDVVVRGRAVIGSNRTFMELKWFSVCILASYVEF